uniref:Arginine-hydroxylase NDUFAF5, mitochondrial n=1 Tax=Meloidogyne enterolobii TaxID=390850 RepID=A0A6V7U2V4_MELEN|nr:unnamed protein product [Meloidogyne enterolobii]
MPIMASRLFCHLRSASTSASKVVPPYIKVFDRETKRKQRNWSANQSEFELTRFIRDEFGYRLADKVFDLLKKNTVCIDLGCGAGHIGMHLIRENVGCLIQLDMSEAMVRASKSAEENEFPTFRAIADEELVPFRPECADLILSGLSAHWINDLPNWFLRCFQTLREDGVMIGGLLAGETLHELRISLQLAEMERLGGIGAHVSPFVEAQDIASLMNRAGFQLVTIDVDEIVINYPDIFSLIFDLQFMGESNATFTRSASLRRDILIAADGIYRQMFCTQENNYPATFQMINFIGWKPGANMPKVARRGSQSVSFKDLSKFIETEMTRKENDEFNNK